MAKTRCIGKRKNIYIRQICLDLQAAQTKTNLTNLSRIEIILVILNERYQMFLSKGKQYEQFRQHGSLT